MAVPPSNSEASANPEVVSGRIVRIKYHDEESGFSAIEVKSKQFSDSITVVGPAFGLHKEDEIKAAGVWVKEKKYGDQFRAESIQALLPVSSKGIKRFLTSKVLMGMSKGLANRLYKKFGQEMFDVLEHHPKRLADVKGLKEKQIENILRNWKEHRALHVLLSFLQQYGVNAGQALSIHKQLGASALTCIREDPYRLTLQVRGVGFRTADQIALGQGMPQNAPKRVKAGLEFVLQELASNGHCAALEEQLVTEARKILNVPAEDIYSALEFGIQEKRLIMEQNMDGQKFVYLKPFHIAEVQLAQCILALSRHKHPCPPFDAASTISWVQKEIGLELDPVQKEAILQATQHKAFVITGGPGVGKTTIIDAIIRIFRRHDLKVVLAAPTGRAAKRMTETTGLKASTLHRLLEFSPQSNTFERNPENPLKGQVFIFDESSMLDLTLAWHAIRALPADAALVLVGDVDQLPSVGPGNILRDIIASKTVPVCRLTKVFRQAAQSEIITNAHRINAGEAPSLSPARTEDSAPLSDFYFSSAEAPEKAQNLIVRLIQEAIPRRFKLNSMSDIQVLTPMRKGPLGVQALNQLLQAELNPVGDEIHRFGVIYRKGDKVMQMVNNYDKEVFNGDIGSVISINNDDDSLLVNFDDKEVLYQATELDALSHSYATTIHKSQGSEYPAVIVVMHPMHYIMLQRNLLYTAVTRGKKLVVLVGTSKAVATAARKMDVRKRVTRLKERLTNGGGML